MVVLLVALSLQRHHHVSGRTVMPGMAPNVDRAPPRRRCRKGRWRGRNVHGWIRAVPTPWLLPGGRATCFGVVTRRVRRSGSRPSRGRSRRRPPSPPPRKATTTVLRRQREQPLPPHAHPPTGGWADGA
jgi:hypothetical protein